MFFRSFLFVSLGILATPAFAAAASAQENQVDRIVKCQLEGEINFKVDTQIHCDRDLTIAPGTHITVAAGRELQVWVSGDIHYPSKAEDYSIQAENSDSVVFISAINPTGHLKIEGGDVSLEYATPVLLSTYEQELPVGAEMSLNGQAVPLTGAMLKPSL